MTATIIEAALRALVFAAAVGAGLRVFRVTNVPVRKAAWTVVLVASLAMPLLMRWPALANWTTPWGWTLPVPAHATAGTAPVVKSAPAALEAAMPAVLKAPSKKNQDPLPANTRVESAPATLVTVQVDASPMGAPTPGFLNHARFDWPPSIRLIAMVYFAVAGALLIRLLWGLVMALRLWATADLVSPLTAPEPNVRSSARIPSPVTIGSGIVLPANYTEWDRKKLRMVLAHERSHVRQQDFYLQLLAGLYTAVFWFSPLGWWLRRTLASLGEAIGDRAGLDAAASRSRYAEVLLEFAAMPHRALPGVAMARPGNLSRRVEQLLNEHLFRTAFAEGRRRAALSLLVIPAAFFAVTALVRIPNVAAQSAPVPPTAPSAASAPIAPRAKAPVAPNAPADAPLPPADGQIANPPGVAPVPAAGDAPEGVAPTLAPVAPLPGVAPSPAVAPVPPNGIQVDDSDVPVVSDDDQDAKGYSWHFGDDGESYAFVEGSGDNITFSGSWDGDRRAEIDAARKVARGPFLWFTHEGKSYIVTDPAIIARIRAMYKPMEDLGRQQEALGKQQEALGRQMEDLGRQQEDVGQVKMPDLTKEIADLNATMEKFNADRQKLNTKELSETEAKLKAAQDQMMTPERMAELQADLAAAQAEWNSDSMGALQEKLGDLQGRLGELQGEAGARQGGVGAKMGALGAKQGKLGAEQGRIGAEQGRIAQRADQETRRVIEESLRNGKATQVPQVK